MIYHIGTKFQSNTEKVPYEITGPISSDRYGGNYPISFTSSKGVLTKTNQSCSSLDQAIADKSWSIIYTPPSARIGTKFKARTDVEYEIIESIVLSSSDYNVTVRWTDGTGIVKTAHQDLLYLYRYTQSGEWRYTFVPNKSICKICAAERSVRRYINVLDQHFIISL